MRVVARQLVEAGEIWAGGRAGGGRERESVLTVWPLDERLGWWARDSE